MIQIMEKQNTGLNESLWELKADAQLIQMGVRRGQFASQLGVTAQL
jgi:hypothetical protein